MEEIRLYPRATYRQATSVRPRRVRAGFRVFWTVLVIGLGLAVAVSLLDYALEAEVQRQAAVMAAHRAEIAELEAVMGR